MHIPLTVASTILLSVLLNNAGAQSPASSQRADSENRPSHLSGRMEVLTDTGGIDFGPYLYKMLGQLRNGWYAQVPEEARSPELKPSTTTVQFAIQKNGSVTDAKIVVPSGIASLDRAALAGVKAASPFDALPATFKGRNILIRFEFRYNVTTGSREPQDHVSR